MQSDETGVGVKNNGIFKLDIINGNLETVGSEVAIGDEHFYIISNTDGEITMLAKYNLEVGNVCTSFSSCTLIENASGIQDLEMIGYPPDGSYPRYGTTAFSSTNYWSSTVSTYPAYVYDSNSTLYNYVESYKTYLESQGVEIEEARLIKVEELEALGCSMDDLSCSEAPEWVYGTTYWSGSANGSSGILRVLSDSPFSSNDCFYDYYFGVRPVIVLKS